MDMVIEAIIQQCRCSKSAARYAAGILEAKLASVIEGGGGNLGVGITAIRQWVDQYDQQLADEKH